MWAGHRDAKNPWAGHRRATSSPRHKAVTKLRRRESHREGHSWEDLDNPLGRQPEQYQLELIVLPLFYLLPQLPIGHIHPEHKGSLDIFHPSQPLLWTHANRKWRAAWRAEQTHLVYLETSTWRRHPCPASSPVSLTFFGKDSLQTSLPCYSCTVDISSPL